MIDPAFAVVAGWAVGNLPKTHRCASGMENYCSSSFCAPVVNEGEGERIAVGKSG